MALQCTVEGDPSNMHSLIQPDSILECQIMNDDSPINFWMAENDPYIALEETVLIEEETAGYKDVEKDKEEEKDKEGVVGGEILEPFVGMEFGTIDEAYNFYNAYACKVGFSIRKQSQTKSKVGVSSVKFVCNKEGFSKRQKNEQQELQSDFSQRTPERQHGHKRTGCKASLRIRLLNGVIWTVSIFDKEHNHVLITSPSKHRNLRSQKHLSFEDKEIILDLNSQNVGSSQILGYLATKHGGKKNITFKQKDVSNQIAMENRKLIGVDVKSTLQYFRKRHEEDPEFFFKVDGDENGVVQHIFWIDGRARRTFLEIGDVVTFDTTYNTNKYFMPLAPFIGPNHHRQSVFYGMTLIRSEKVRNFEWLFQTWLKAMYGKHPTSIITDQDPAMRVAINKVFPNTIHRCCQWHVMRKAREHLVKQYSSLDEFEKKLKEVIIHSLTISDFEKSWKQMIEHYKLEDHNHLNVMFKSAPEWVPAYFRGSFFADMSTTQRSESMNAMLKLWLNSHTSIYRFVQKIDSMVEGIWHRESDEDIKSMTESPQLWSHYEIEKRAREVYTRTNFRLGKTEALIAFRKTSLELIWRQLVDMACTSPDAFSFVKSGITQLKEDLMLVVEAEPNKADQQSDEVEDEDCKRESDDSANAYIDPPISNCKGRKKRPARFKPYVELNVIKRRTCSYCHAKEAHNIRTCSKRIRDLGKGKNKATEEDEESNDTNNSN